MPAEGGGAPEGGAAFAHREAWAHLSLQYEQPWRPTWARMEQRPPDFGDEGMVPLALSRSAIAGRPPLPEFLSLWELIGVLNIRQPLKAECFILVASEVK